MRGPLRIAGPVVIVVGIGLMVYSALDYANAVGTEQSSINVVSQRTLRAPSHGWVRWAGMALIATGVVITSVGFELFASRKAAGQTSKPARRRPLDQPLGQRPGKSPPGGRTGKRDRRDSGNT